MRLVQRRLANPTPGHSHFLRKFQRPDEYLVHYQSKELCSRSAVIHDHLTMLIIKPRVVSILSVHCPISFKHMFFMWCPPNHIPLLKYMCSVHMSDRIEHVYLIGLGFVAYMWSHIFGILIV